MLQRRHNAPKEPQIILYEKKYVRLLLPLSINIYHKITVNKAVRIDKNNKQEKKNTNST